MAAWPARVDRGAALEAARAAAGAQGERLVLDYLPLTFSRRHGDPSRPWNRFSIRVRDAAGRRVVNYEGNWRDIFQNWEALLPSEPAYAGSMIAAFLGAMTADGYNPYRIGRDGIDWEVVEPDNPWSHIGYWGDHQVIYLLRLLEAAQARDPGAAASPLGPRAVQLRRRALPAQAARRAGWPARSRTIVFDDAAHRARACTRRAHRRRMVCGCATTPSEPVLATLAEKLAIILLAKAGSLVPGGGLWLHTQRPGVERREQRAGGLRAVGGDAGASAALAESSSLDLPGAERPFDAARRRHWRRCRRFARPGARDAAVGRRRRRGTARLPRRRRCAARPLARGGLPRRGWSRAGTRPPAC